jgi:hypothetical protein
MAHIMSPQYVASPIVAWQQIPTMSSSVHIISCCRLSHTLPMAPNVSTCEPRLAESQSQSSLQVLVYSQSGHLGAKPLEELPCCFLLLIQPWH